MDYRVQKVIGFMKDDLRRRLTLSQMARFVNITPEHFCRIFKAETGMSPAKYLKRLRLQQAKKLLESTFLSVKEVMLMVGLNDESHFVRDFEAIFGLAPMRYRALCLSFDLSSRRAENRSRLASN